MDGVHFQKIDRIMWNGLENISGRGEWVDWPAAGCYFIAEAAHGEEKEEPTSLLFSYAWLV